MNNSIWIIGIFIILLIIIFFLNKKEKFFVQFQDVEFRGINMLGLNSDSTSVPAKNVNECKDLCERNKSCTGYTYYYPGQQCYIFNSKGGFVPERPGYISGMKIQEN
jgi:hypothetical protein